jgi:hypothetical protein
MNIVVVGGGSFGRFGNDFVRSSKAAGHTVRVLSHRTSIDTDATINFLNITDAVEQFNKITQDSLRCIPFCGGLASICQS